MSFADAGRDHKPKGAGGNKELEEAREWMFSEPPEKPILGFCHLVRLISDF